MDVKQLDCNIITEDNYKLVATQFYVPSSECKGVILIASATAVKRRYYYKFASFIASQGYTVICFDYRGIGDSLHGDIREFEGRIRDWGEKDLVAMINWTKSNFPDNKLHMLCHSIGGQMLGLASNNSKIDSILHCSVQSGYWRFWNGFERYKLFVMWHLLVPTLTRLLKYFPSKKLGVGENMPKGIIFEWASWCRDPEYMFGKHNLTSIKNLNNIVAPVRSYSFGGDSLAPPASVDYMSNRYTCDVDRIHIKAPDIQQKSIGHFDIFRSKMESTLWLTFLGWFDSHK